MLLLVYEGGSGSSGGTVPSSGDYPLLSNWVKPRFIKTVVVKATDSFYRVELYRKNGDNYQIVDSKPMNDQTKSVIFYYPNGVYMPNGLKVVVKDALANDVISMWFEGVHA